MATNDKAVTKQSHLESLITEGIKAVSSQETINAVSIATAAKTFFNLNEKQAAAIGVGFALLSQHLESKGDK